MLVPPKYTSSTFSPGWNPVAVKEIASPAAPDVGLTNNSAMVNALNASEPCIPVKSLCIEEKSWKLPPDLKKFCPPAPNPAPNPELKLDDGEMFESIGR